MPSDDELLERTLVFSGSFVSDDGHVTIRRSPSASFQYTGTQYVGYCARCAQAGLIPRQGKELPGIHAAIAFATTHDHGGRD